MLGVCTLRVSVCIVGALLCYVPFEVGGSVFVLFVLVVTLAWRALLVRRPLPARVPWVRLTGPVCLACRRITGFYPTLRTSMKVQRPGASPGREPRRGQVNRAIADDEPDRGPATTESLLRETRPCARGVIGHATRA